MNNLSKLFLLLSLLFIFSAVRALTGEDLKRQIETALGSVEPIEIEQGTYIVEDPIKIYTNGMDLNIIIPKNTVIQGGTISSELLEPVIDFIGPSGDTTGSVIISGSGNTSRLNCLNCSPGNATQGATGINAQDLYRLEVTGMTFYAGTDEDGNGDSGITTVNVRTVRLLFNEFIGWDDVGTYISGDENETGNDLGQYALLYGNYYQSNHVSMSSKRNFRFVKVQQNVFNRGFVDITAFPTGNNGSGKEIEVINNKFYHTTRNVVDARDNFIKVTMTNNLICRPYYYQQELGASIFKIHSGGTGQIITNGNRIDQRYLNGAPNYDPTTIIHNDFLVNGC